MYQNKLAGGLRLLMAGLAIFAAGCDEQGTEAGSLVPEIASLDVISGQDQVGQPGEELGEPLVVRVLDASGQPIGDQIVNFRVVSGGGSVFAGTALTNGEGIAQERWTLGDTMGEDQSVEARAVDSSSGEKRVFATFTAQALEPVASVTVDPNSASLSVGNSTTLSAAAMNGSGQEVDGYTATWSSSDPSIASVNGSGSVSAVAAGSAQITATMGGQSASASITVTQPQTSGPPANPTTPRITTSPLSADSFTVAANWDAAANATGYAWATGGNGTAWQRSGNVNDTKLNFNAPRNGASSYWFCIRSVGADGTQSASPACNSYAAPATSAPTVGSVTVSPTTASVAAGSTVSLTATVRDQNGNTMSSPAPSWTSSNTAVATVSSNGTVSGVSSGSATITASAGGRSASAAITVTSSTPTPTPTPPPSGENVLFSSNWSAGTGDTDFATSDGNTWPYLVCPDFARRPVLRVVQGSNAGWTATPNVLQVTNRGSSNCGQLETRSDIPQGRDYFVRMYIRVEDEDQIGFHSVAINCCGDIQASAWAIFNPTAGVSYDPVMFLETPGSTSWIPTSKIQMRRWYRFEWHVDFVSNNSTRARIWPRIYDMAGNLVHDASSYRNTDTGQTLKQFYDGGGVHTFTNTDLARRFAVGYEGNAMARDTGRRWFYAGVEIRSDTWPGPIN